MELLAVAAAGGLCVGSFLNTCIYRVPRGLSLLRPRSQCPKCGQVLGMSELIPLWGYLRQRGRCRHCGEAIGAGYPLVELGAAALAVMSILIEGLSPAFLRTFGLACVFLAIAVVDYRHRIIPNVFVGAGLVIALLGAPWGGTISALESAVGFLVAGGGFALARAAYARVRGREGMGAGDVKLAALMGAGLGAGGWLLATLLGSLAAVTAGVALILGGRATWHSPLPYGSFLSGAAIAVLLGFGFLPR